MRSAGHWLAMACLGLGAVAAGLLGRGESSAVPARDAGAVPSSDFTDVFAADLAGDARSLSLAIAGLARGSGAGRLTVRVYRRSGRSGWTRSPLLRKRLDSSGSVSLLQFGGVPCAGYPAARAGPVLACLRHGAWRRLPRSGLPGRRANLTALSASGGRLVASFQTADELIVFRLKGRRWRRLARPVRRGEAVAVLGEDSLDLALVDLVADRRTLFTYRRGRWRREAPLEGVGGGPMPGGPVRLGSPVYLPVNDASSQPWQFSVHVFHDGAWSRLGQPLSRGAGNAQGTLQVAGGSVWASWQEHDPRRDGRFDTRVFVRRVAPARGEAIEVWRGISIGPGDVEVVQAAGRRWVLYMPQGARGLTVRVRAL